MAEIINFYSNRFDQFLLDIVNNPNKTTICNKTIMILKKQEKNENIMLEDWFKIKNKIRRLEKIIKESK